MQRHLKASGDAELVTHLREAAARGDLALAASAGRSSAAGRGVGRRCSRCEVTYDATALVSGTGVRTGTRRRRSARAAPARGTTARSRSLLWKLPLAPLSNPIA